MYTTLGPLGNMERTGTNYSEALLGAGQRISGIGGWQGGDGTLYALSVTMDDGSGAVTRWIGYSGNQSGRPAGGQANALDLSQGKLTGIRFHLAEAWQPELSVVGLDLETDHLQTPHRLGKTGSADYRFDLSQPVMGFFGMSGWGVNALGLYLLDTTSYTRLTPTVDVFYQDNRVKTSQSDADPIEVWAGDSVLWMADGLEFQSFQMDGQTWTVEAGPKTICGYEIAGSSSFILATFRTPTTGSGVSDRRHQYSIGTSLGDTDPALIDRAGGSG